MAQTSHANSDAASGNMHPLLKDRLHRQRSVFSPGQRIRMNILPMFLNIFVPWAVFIITLGTCAFWVMYRHPGMGNTAVYLGITVWFFTALIAYNRRRYDPDPAWFTYFAFALGLAIWGGWLLGTDIFQKYSLPYYMVKDLKVIGHLDVSKERGQNVMDVGIAYFADGNKIDAMRSWHFKDGAVYCVAPLIKGTPGSAMPETQSFDFWAVGKDCCSESASDFRCGAFNNPLARSGIRVLDKESSAFYRLAVEQAETLYGVLATHPVFFEWSQDPLAEVNSWNARGFTHFIVFVIGAFVVALFGVAVASCKFSFLGRAESVYETEAFDNPEWQQGGYNSAI